MTNIPSATTPPVRCPIKAILLSVYVALLSLVSHELHADSLPINHTVVHVLLRFNSLLLRLERQRKTVLHGRFALLQLDGARAKSGHNFLHVRHRYVPGDAGKPKNVPPNGVFGRLKLWRGGLTPLVPV
jgi:hypothetical protein